MAAAGPAALAQRSGLPSLLVCYMPLASPRPSCLCGRWSTPGNEPRPVSTPARTALHACAPRKGALPAAERSFKASHPRARVTSGRVLRLHQQNMRTRPRRTKVAEDKAQQRRQRRAERAARRRRLRGSDDDDDEDLDDEALARRLQREYDDEARGRRRSKKRRRSEPTPQETIQQQTGLASPPTPRRSEVTRRESFGVRLKLNGETSDKLIASPPKRPVVPLPTPPKEGLTPDLDLEPWKADGWDALCLVCGDGGDVACCDGCPAVIHPRCAGLAKMPDESEPFFCRTCEKDRCGCCLEGPIRKEDHVV